MKSYSVKELASLLHTNPETIRRWIRAGKLKSQQTPSKGENIILESDLNSFLEKYPKYASIVTGVAIGSTIATPFGAIAAAIASGTVIAFIKNNLNSSRVSQEELTTLVQCAIAEKEKEYADRCDEVEEAQMQLKKTIRLKQQTEKELEELKAMIPAIKERRE